MANFSLVALDMDGTLLNSRLEISERNREAIRRAAAAGKHIVISTGRCLAELQDILAVLPEVRYIICENGCCVYDRKYECDIHILPVPAEDIIFMLDLVKDERVVLQVFHDNASYFNRADSEWAEDFSVGPYKPIFDRASIWDVRLFDNYARRPFRVEKMNMYFSINKKN